MNALALILTVLAVIVVQAAPTQHVMKDKPGAIGGQRDKHGCLVAAGYTWCQPLKQCIRPWETECNSLADDDFEL